MSAVVALYWNQPTLQMVVARSGRIQVADSIELEPGASPAALGQRLAEALTPHSLGRTKTVVAIGRQTLEWQHLSLPPCPPEELTDVVRLQADQDLSAGDDEVGFDYLPLVGDEQTSYQVLTVEIPSAELDKIREICRAANLTLDRVVPLATGWPALALQAAQGTAASTTIFVAPQTKEAMLWATREGKIVIFRQFQIAATEDHSTLQAAIGSELRRTLLSMPQHAQSGPTSVLLVDRQANSLQEVANSLDAALDVSVGSIDLTSQHEALAASQPSAAPLAGLALDELQGTRPVVDLLHPRRRPHAQVNVRTYALAATAAILCVALLGWTGYARLQAPLDQAAVDQAELTLLNEPLEQLEEYEQRAAAIRNWTTAAPNMLVHLQQVSKQIRPHALDAEDFPVDQDVVLESLAFDKRKLTIDALARNSRLVAPLEMRLRDVDYLPQRDKSDASQTLPGYPWHFKSTVEVTPASDTAATSLAEEQPPS